ncbi:MAG: hypothetical protein M3137_19605 [Actinomycetota bacterium]|nr:hypothetical protein [Actinomycetota bacterium]
MAAPVVALVVGAYAHRWAAEDAYIDFRIIHNIWSGYGPVFNPGERVEVFTDPLWVFILSVFGWLLPLVRLAWWAVILGITAAAGGFLLGARAAQRLAAWRGLPTAIPLGLIAASVIDGVWDFASSGLETGLIFGWEGLSWWLLVRAATTTRGFAVTAFVVGLGELIRPDLGLLTITFLAALAVIIYFSRPQRPMSALRRWAVPAVVAAGVPVVYQVWRMAYFAMITPNTALAKSAGRSWWSQGARYFGDFVTADRLYVPLVVLTVVIVARLAGAGYHRDWVSGVVLAAPVLGGAADWAYVVRVGGDFMHARMLVPGLFAVGLAAWVCGPRVRAPSLRPPSLGAPRVTVLSVVPIALITGFAIVCVAHLRYANTGQIMANGITNERLFWVRESGSPHPVTADEYRTRIRIGTDLAALARTVPPKSVEVSLIDMVNGAYTGPPRPFLAGRPERVIAEDVNIGLTGASAGAHVYIYDLLSLADPVGSHTTLATRGRPGHEKTIGSEWLVARFLPAGATVPAAGPAQQVAAARAATWCGPLHAYLHAITTPLSLQQLLGNVSHSVGYTRMTFSATPTLAAQKLCAHS